MTKRTSGVQDSVLVANAKPMFPSRPRPTVKELRADPALHLTGTCDNCGDSGAFAYCVTNAKSHLHACRKPDCKDALEKKLHGKTD